MPRTAGIHAEALHKTYPGGVRALDGLSFEVTEGVIFALLGPNGAGKTTTVKILTTLTRPERGAARVSGIDVLAHPARVRRVIGTVGQRAAGIRGLSGRENLVLQGELYGLRGAELRRRVEMLLGRFGLEDAADRQVQGYSGGMQRRLDVAMGLVHRPLVLFLDEPTTGLDPEARTGTWRALHELAADSGLTMLLTTHYLEEADQFAARVGIVDRGRIVAEGVPDALKAELGGDLIQMAFDAPDSATRALEVLSSAVGPGRISLDDAVVHARVADGGHAVPSFLTALDARGLHVASVRVARPSLDDVYLHHTGRSLHGVEEDAAA